MDKNLLNGRILRIVSRTSPLAMTQTHEVINALMEQHNLTQSDFEIILVKNVLGDMNLKDPLHMMGGLGVFTKQVDQVLHDQRADIAVHSLKDLPTNGCPRLTVAAHTKSQPRGDIVILHKKHHGITSLTQLPKGSIIGTSSLRRSSNFMHRFPQLLFKNLRGNINTRILKLDESNEYDGIILAKAGLLRLSLQHRISIELDEEEFLYAPGQGVLGVQCRSNDLEVISLLQCINDRESFLRCTSERQFLHKLEGGCKLPIGVYSELREDNKVFLIGQVWSQDGQITIRESLVGDYNEVGIALSIIMKQKGATEILASCDHF